MNGSFVSNIRAQRWYNDEQPRNLSGFVNDKSNRLIGWATMRQLRIHTNSCRLQKSIANLFHHCNADYSFFDEERRSFNPGWINQTNAQISNSSIDRAYAYQSDGYIYIGKHQTYNSGGYIYQFRGRLNALQSNLSELYHLRWIDSQTRAVIIELTLYNANSQLFTSVILLTEFLPTGGVETQSRFEPISFQGY